jgi:hypothetical protein
MKRLFAIVLCLVLMLTLTTACKPDNITYPSVITDPENTEDPGTAQQPNETPQAPTEETPEPNTDTTASGNDLEEVVTDTAVKEAEKAPEEKPEEEPKEEEKLPVNPLADTAFKPATGVTNTLGASGLVKPGAAVSALKNRTITFYTADDQPAFSYTDEKGQPVTEWEWMSKLAAENGFILKYSIKNDTVSLKSQRIALFAGKKLSLVQMGIQELASGLGLSQSATDFLDKKASSFGISKTVLSQSDDRLFAPIGNVNTLWYNADLMPADADPNTMSKGNQWTVSTFKEVYNNAAEKHILPLIMQEVLPWATLSGKSPLTLLDGKLDSNINAAVTRAVWTTLKETEFADFERQPNTEYSLANGNTAMIYTATPQNTQGLNLKYAPLPAAESGKDGTVTFTGTFFALPKYETNEESILAALSFAELWCNRYTETRAATLQGLGISGEGYQAYCNLAEQAGQLILHDRAIEDTVKTYLSGLTDSNIDMNDAYAEVKDRVKAIVAVRNIYY